MAGTLGDEAGGGCDVGSRQGVGGVEGAPQGSWWRAKAPRQSGPGSQVWAKVVVTEAVSPWSFPSPPSKRKRFLLVLLCLVSFLPLPMDNYVMPADHSF